MEISVGETQVKQNLKPIDSLTVLRNDTGKGYHGWSMTRSPHSELFDYQEKGYVVTGLVEISLVVQSAPRLL